MARFQTVDLALDPFPFNGHTTTCDSLWMGVPTVSLSGQSYVQRYGGTALTQVGLQELVTPSVDAYKDAAVAWASDLNRLTEQRHTLRARMLASPLCDAPGFARRLEAAYRWMWLTWVNQQHGLSQPAAVDGRDV